MSKKIDFFKNILYKNLVGIIGILVFAGFLRLYKISEYMNFLGDEGRDVLVVKDIIDGFGRLFMFDIPGAMDKLTLLGPTSSVGGFFLGPIYYYFMVPFLFLFRYDPIGPAVMVALFGVATVFLVYKVGSEFFGKFAGYTSAFLYAISPIVIAYSRSSWQTNLMPFFSLLTLYLLYKGIVNNRKKLFFICGILFGIMMQLHSLAVFLAVVIGSYTLLGVFFAQKKFVTGEYIKKICNYYALMFFGFVVGWSLFLGFEIRHGFTNTKNIIKFIFTSGDTGGGEQFFPIVENVLFRLFGRLVATYLPADQIAAGKNFIPFDLLFLHLQIPLVFITLLTILLVLGSVIILVRKLLLSYSLKNEMFFQSLLLVLWLFIGVCLFGFYKKSIYDYYFQFMFPLPFLLTGGLLSFLFFQKKFSSLFRIIVIFFFLVFVLLNLNGIPFKYAANNQKGQVKTISDFVLSKTGGKPFNFALITGGNSDHAYRYYFKLEGRDPVVIENQVKDPERKTVTDQLLVVCEDTKCQPLGNSLFEVAGFGRAEIVGQWDVIVVKVYKLKHYIGK